MAFLLHYSTISGIIVLGYNLLVGLPFMFFNVNLSCRCSHKPPLLTPLYGVYFLCLIIQTTYGIMRVKGSGKCMGIILQKINNIKGSFNCMFRGKHEFEYFKGYGYRCKHCFKTRRQIREVL